MRVSFIPSEGETRGVFLILSPSGYVQSHFTARAAITHLEASHANQAVEFEGIDWLGREAVFAIMREVEADDIATLRSINHG